MAYDVFKDTYKIYADGEKVVSGSWSENPNVSKNKRVNKNATIIDPLTILSLVGTHNTGCPTIGDMKVKAYNSLIFQASWPILW